MDAKLDPFIYEKGNNLEVVYINPNQGVKITLSNPQRPTDECAIMLPLERLESFIYYLAGIAKITGIKIPYGKDCKMRALDVTEKKAKSFDEMENKAITVIEKVLSEGRDVDDLTKVALQSLNIVAKNRQTLTNRQAIGWSIAHTIATPEELKKYIEVTNPELSKLLQGDKVKKV